jgi:hypothetical protein
VVSKKVGRPDVAPSGEVATRPAAPARRSTATGRTAISSPRGGRPRSHSLVPAHVGELGAVALLVMGIIGVALFIAGLAMVVQGITIGSTFAASPPPNIAELGIPHILLGVGVMAAGAAETGAALLVLMNRRRSRLVAMVVDGVVAALALAGALLVVTVGGRDAVLTISLVIVAVLLILALVALARRR